MRDLARKRATRLSKDFQEKEALQAKQESRKKEEQSSKFNLKNPKPRSTNASLPLNANANLKKKVDNVNTDFIRYISERQEKKGSTHLPPGSLKQQEEQ